jgi:hypothetical protein
MMAKQRKWETKKYQIALQRGGVSHFDDAYDARTAARKATKHARTGWRAEVQTFSGRGLQAGRKTVHMTCKPVARGRRTVAECVLKPAFKKRVKGF